MSTKSINAELFRQLSYIADDENCMKKALDYIRKLAIQKEKAQPLTATDTLAEDIVPYRTKEELKDKEALTVINEVIIPALNIVGKDYETGKIFLPQLIQSAETTKKAFEVVKETFSANDGEEKGPIIIATVEGDIHDIGKNIVKVVLESYGYKIIDLGKDVKVEKVVEAYKKYKPKAIGLSALMTTTVASMERTIKALHEAGCSEPIWVGGAVVTEDIAHNIGADYYTEDAMAAVNLLENEILDL